MEDSMLCGYSLDEIEDIAAGIFENLSSEHVPIRLAILALCRTITMMGSEEDMDLACLMIDKIRELTAEGEYDIDELIDEDEDEDI